MKLSLTYFELAPKRKNLGANGSALSILDLIVMTFKVWISCT